MLYVIVDVTYVVITLPLPAQRPAAVLSKSSCRHGSVAAGPRDAGETEDVTWRRQARRPSRPTASLLLITPRERDRRRGERDHRERGKGRG